MALNRSWIKGIEHDAAGYLDFFITKSGQRYYYDHVEAALAIFMYAVNADEGASAPEFVRAVLEEAKDPAAVLGRFSSPKPSRQFVDPLALLDERSKPQSHEDDA